MTHNLIKKSLRNIKEILFQNKFLILNSPVMDTKENCFDFLLMKNHMCVSSKDTFFVSKTTEQNPYVLRPHCSNFQVIVFESKKEEVQECFNAKNRYAKYASIGKVFRKDQSSRHSYFFHQFDGLIVYNEKSVFEHIEDLMEIIFQFLGFKTKYLIRESYFPFTYALYEVDIWHDESWIEVLGCGFTNSEILDNCKYQNYQNKVFAFGCGIERLIMIKHKINNIHNLRTT